MVTTGQCPACFATNSFSATHCLDCRQQLPWAGAIADLQQKVNSATEAAEAAKQAQVQASQQNHHANLAQSIQNSQTIRAQNANRARGINAPILPGQALPVNAFHVFTDAFVGRFAEALEDFDKASAAWFGMFCMVISNVCIVIGARMIFNDVSNLIHSFLPFVNLGAATPPVNPFGIPGADNGATTPGSNPVPGAVDLISLWKWAVVAFTPWLSVALSCTLARKVFGGEERHLEGDVFIAGVTLLPFGILVLLTGMLGYTNWRLISFISVFTMTYTILLLYRGLTTVSNVRDMAAAYCVPLVLIMSAGLTYTVFSRLLTL
jgi:hypothetical protein